MLNAVVLHKERLNEEFQKKQQELDQLAEAKTAKRRMKRQKKKLKRLNSKFTYLTNFLFSLEKGQLKTDDSAIKEDIGSGDESPDPN